MAQRRLPTLAIQMVMRWYQKCRSIACWDDGFTEVWCLNIFAYRWPLGNALSLRREPHQVHGKVGSGVLWLVCLCSLDDCLQLGFSKG